MYLEVLVPIRSGDKAPYAPPATLMLVIEGFRDRGLSTPFTQEVLIRAGVTESLAPRTLASLEQLDLIDGDGNPTDAMEGIRRAPTEDYQDRLAEVIRGAYAEVFQFTDPANDSRGRVEDAFRAYEPAGQRKRMVVTFLGLCQAAGIVSDTVASTREPRGSYKTRSKSKKGGPAETKRTAPKRSDPPPSPPPAVTGVHPAIAGLIQSIPSNGRGWTEDERETFLETFRAVIDFAIPIRAEKSERPQTESLEAEV